MFYHFGFLNPTNRFFIMNLGQKLKGFYVE